MNASKWSFCRPAAPHKKTKNKARHKMKSVLRCAKIEEEEKEEK
jgi:hypothetical protein